MRTIGTVARGVRLPVIVKGDDLENIVVESVLNASDKENFQLRDKDIIAITEAVVARAQGNYATIDEIALDIERHFNGEPIGVVFPIFSRNRFSIILKAISQATSKVYLQLNYPSDEVGNHIVSLDQIYEKDVDPHKDSYDEKEFREVFGNDTIHEFTGVDYIDFYKSMGDNIEITFCNDPRHILYYSKNVIACDIHTRKRTKRILQSAYHNKVITLDEIMNSPINGSGFNEEYGLLGSNKAGEEKVKLFPRNCKEFVNNVKNKIDEATGKDINVMVYGDGAFKDPIGKIWELADPVVSPAYTEGLKGTTNELKLKYLADTKFKDLKGEELNRELAKYIGEKDISLVGQMESEGTTPRQITDLVGSLCDLISGSGDKGTPVVVVQGYFDNYSSL